MEIKEVLKESRKKLSLTQGEVAERIFVSQKSVSNWENGKTYPDIDSLIRLARLYDLSLDNLLMEGADIVEDIKKREKIVNLTRIYFFGPFLTGILLLMMMYLPSRNTSPWSMLLIVLAFLTNFVPILYFKFKIYKLKGLDNKLERELKHSKILLLCITVVLVLFIIFLYLN